MKTVYPQIVTSADMLKSTIQLEQLIEKLKKIMQRQLPLQTVYCMA